MALTEQSIVGTVIPVELIVDFQGNAEPVIAVTQQPLRAQTTKLRGLKLVRTVIIVLNFRAIFPMDFLSIFEGLFTF